MPIDPALCEQFTVGVEEEYQLVSPETGELQNDGDVVLADLTGEVAAEVQQTMVEIGTPVCRTSGEIHDRLRERRFQAAAAAASRDLDIIAAGTHPFSSWKDQILSEGDRPEMLASIFRQLLRQQAIWGLHVHVAIPERLDRAVLMNTVRTFGPHLLALSASSPYHLGDDTGFASYRTISWRGYPFVGPPPRFASDQAYDDFLELLLKSGSIPDGRTLYWSVRPSARYPTLELRMCDACPRLEDAVSIAAFGRAIIVAAAEGKLSAAGDSLLPSLQDEMLRENEWIAARDGLDAILIDPDSERSSVPVHEAIEDLLTTVEPIAERLGDAESLVGIRHILKQGNAADRMRDYHEHGKDIQQLAHWLVEETRAGTGADRRSERRETKTREPAPTSR